jgi:hypothetical protein
MTPGKAAAQVAHAASQAAFQAYHGEGGITYEDWERSAGEEPTGDQFAKKNGHYDGFGTTIVLDGESFEHIDEAPTLTIPMIKSALAGCLHGFVKDPGYPLRDGKKTHHLDLYTCYWVLVDTEEHAEAMEHLSQFDLYSGNHD